MAFHATATRLWKSLTPDERLRAAAVFFAEPPPELIGAAIGALVKARHLRPQAARALAPDAQARILATVLDPGEPVAQGLLVGLHLAERRPLLGAFLDALKLAARGRHPEGGGRRRAPGERGGRARGRGRALRVSRRPGADLPQHALAPGPGALALAREASIRRRRLDPEQRLTDEEVPDHLVDLRIGPQLRPQLEVARLLERQPREQQARSAASATPRRTSRRGDRASPRGCARKAP